MIDNVEAKLWADAFTYNTPFKWKNARWIVIKNWLTPFSTWVKTEMALRMKTFIMSDCIIRQPIILLSIKHNKTGEPLLYKSYYPLMIFGMPRTK